MPLHRDFGIGMTQLQNAEPDNDVREIETHYPVVVSMVEQFDYWWKHLLAINCDYYMIRALPECGFGPTEYDNGKLVKTDDPQLWWDTAFQMTKEMDFITAGKWLWDNHGKKLGIMGPVDGWFFDDLARFEAYGKFEAARCEIVGYWPGLWGIAGNFASGNLIAEPFSRFYGPELDAQVLAGNAAIASNSYWYGPHAWTLMYPWIVQANGAYPPDRVYPDTPAATRANPVEAWLFGRWQWTLRDVLPRYAPYFELETGPDKVRSNQLDEWNLPRLADGESFTGVRSFYSRMASLFDDIGDPSDFYVNTVLKGASDFVRQFAQHYGAAYYGRGPHYADQFALYNLEDFHGLDVRLRSLVKNAGWVERPWAWDWHAEYENYPDTPVDYEEPPTPDPDPDPEPDPDPPVSDGLLDALLRTEAAAIVVAECATEARQLAEAALVKAQAIETAADELEDLID